MSWPSWLVPMIKLQKTAKPQILVDNAEAWTGELLAIVDEGGGAEYRRYQRRRYNHADIKTALREETHAKCAYCESKFDHVTYGDIEHITPRDQDPELTFEWENLTIACDVCNTRKGAIPYGSVVDPYNEAPEDFLVFGGPFAFPVPGIEKAEGTVTRLDLNRSGLIERRGERLKYLGTYLSNIAKTQDAGLREVMIQDFLENELSESQAYNATTLAYFNSMKAKLGLQQ